MRILYAFVQRNATAVRRWPRAISSRFLKADPMFAKALSAAELEDLFDLGYHFKHVDTIFMRVLAGRGLAISLLTYRQLLFLAPLLKLLASCHTRGGGTRLRCR